MKKLEKIVLSGAEVFPLVEGGKGINGTDGRSSGSWAKEGGVGTISLVSPTALDENKNIIEETFLETNREKRHREMVEYAIRGGISQAQIAHDIAGNNGRIHINMLWEMADSEEVIVRVLEGAKGLIHGVTCGAGLPYNLGAIASEHSVYYYPIVSSARAMSILWKRSFKNYPTYLGGVVYEDPWLAGGHNGLSNAEDPSAPADPYLRILELRQVMNGFGLASLPIIIAGGVWWLSEWADYIDNRELGPVAFQFGTRPILTQESPVAKHWYPKLMALKKGDIQLQRFSPTGFYSSAVKNDMLTDLLEREKRQVNIDESSPFNLEIFGRNVPLDLSRKSEIEAWAEKGFTEGLLTPDDTVVFVTPQQKEEILKAQKNCRCCLSMCRFSSWCQKNGTTGKIPDPRSFCIQDSLQEVAHGGDLDNYLMFAGHRAYRFAEDPFYANGFIPTVKQLVDRILTGY